MRSRSRHREGWFLLSTILFTVSARAQQVEYKDLRQEVSNPLTYKGFHADSSCDGTDSESATTTIGCPPATYPFELFLIDIDRSEIPVGGETIALLRLRNVGHDPASVPWVTDADLIELPDENGTYEFVEADLRANIGEDDGGAYFPVSLRLYGTEKLSGSLQRINPGEWIDVKIKLALNCKTEDFRCDLLKAGPAKLSFTWSEYERSETYKKCSIDSKSIRQRELSSEAADVQIIETRKSS